MTTSRTLPRLLLATGATAGLTGILAGLARVGIGAGWGPAHAAHHGALLVVGLFTTVISLERAVALGRGWPLTVPALAAAAGLAMLGRVPGAAWLAVTSAAGLIAINLAIVGRQAVAFTWMMLAASALLAAGHTLWAAGWPIARVVPLWMVFFVLTIAAERLELSRMAPTPRWAHHLLTLVAGAVAVASLVQVIGPVSPGATPAALVVGLALAAIGLWQMRFDLARRTLRHPGLPRYMAVAVQAGASWLVVSGGILAWRGLPPARPIYDAVLHGVFVGYVFSMVFAHAVIILPAVAGWRIAFTPTLYAPLALLHLGLAARIAGDLLGLFWLRRAGSLGNALALALFAITLVVGRAPLSSGGSDTPRPSARRSAARGPTA